MSAFIQNGHWLSQKQMPASKKDGCQHPKKRMPGSKKDECKHPKKTDASIKRRWMPASKGNDYNKDNDALVPIVSVQNRHNIFDDFKKDDGINIRWLPKVNSRTQIETAISLGKNNMVELLIQTESGNDPVIVASDGIKLMDTIKLLSAADTGIKINVKNNIEAKSVLRTLRNEVLDKPVLISIPILSPSTSFDMDR
ncbi:LRP2 [Mytilus coruscus]|uniref:LRP2 n=1 Tax=Mytilus coruscus TaxID=42192 RepID=A0A6J8BNB3_MYTCO|nr:LRP2 [Mytilus coruscus]